MATKYERVKKKGGGFFTGIYCYRSTTRPRVNGHPDRCFTISYKVYQKKRWEKIGWESEGYTPQLAAEVRSKRVRAARHGEEVKTTGEIRAEKLKNNRILQEVKEAYFSSNRVQSLKGRKTDLNRWDKHLKALVGQKRVSDLSPFDIERIKKAMAGKKPATIANALELLRRIINFGVKYNLCPSLEFTIDLPRKDNQVTEYLSEKA